MSNLYRQSSQNRSIGWSTWHFEWCTKYRYKVFIRTEYKNLCKIFLYESAKKYGFNIYDCEVDVDHVHVVVSIPLTMTPVEAVMLMKGFTSKMLFIVCPSLRLDYKKKHLWSPGKFIGSVGHITLQKAKEYLQAHHAKPLESQLFCETKKLPAGQSFRAGRMSIYFLGL
jgi:REP element-mobilizing transposase RayT